MIDIFLRLIDRQREALLLTQILTRLNKDKDAEARLLLDTIGADIEGLIALFDDMEAKLINRKQPGADPRRKKRNNA